MGDGRGQAIALEYVLGIAIAAILIVGLVTAGSTFVENQGKDAARAELRVIGQQLAADIEAVDRLVASGADEPVVRIERDLPTDTAGGYEVALVEREDPRLELESDTHDVSVRVEFTNQTTVAGSTLSGGPIVINYTASGDIRVERGERS